MAEAADREDKLLLTVDEAIALVRRSERERAAWALHVRIDAPTVDPEGSPTGKFFQDGYASWLDLSRADAIRLLERGRSPRLQERGARLMVTRRETHLTSRLARVTYWIGSMY